MDKDTFKFYSFLQTTGNRHSKSLSADSGISTDNRNGAWQRGARSNNTNSDGVIVISDDEDDAREFELLCEVEFETGLALPLPIEQKFICKVEPESIQEGSYSIATTTATTATARNNDSLQISSNNLDVSLDQANLSECEEELLLLVKHEPNCNVLDNGADALSSYKGSGGNNYFIYICPQCGESFETSGSWSEHIDREHKLNDQQKFNFTQRLNDFECNICRAVITRCTLKTLQQHSFTHLPHKAYKCKLCRFEARSLYLMISHIMLHKEREELGDATISAAVKAGNVSGDGGGAALKAQKTLEHESRLLMSYVCPVCGITFDAEDSWQAHINFRHNFLEKTAENRYKDHFKCSECGVEIFSQHIADLQQHLFSHLPYKSFLKCKLCNWTISRRNFMISHIINLHKSHLSASALSTMSPVKPSLEAKAKKPRYFNYDPDERAAAVVAQKKPSYINLDPEKDLAVIAIDDENSLLATSSPPHTRNSTFSSGDSIGDSDSATNRIAHSTRNSFINLRTSLIEKSTTVPTVRSGYSCSGCNNYFKSAAERNKHNVTEHPKYKCKQCDESFALKLHWKQHTCMTKKSMQCKVCTKDYNYEKSFLKHIKSCRPYTPRARHTYTDDTDSD